MTPRDLQIEFPAMITHRAAVDVKIVDRLRMSMADGHGRGAGGVQRDIREHHLNFWARKLSMYYWRWLRNKSDGDLRTHNINGLDPPELRRFPLPDEEYNDWVPSGDLLLDIFKEDANSRAQFLDQQMQLIVGEIGKVYIHTNIFW